MLAEAHAQRRRGEYDEAINLCTRVLRQEPEHADALALLGDIYRELGNYREALGWYQLAVQHNPGRPAIQKRLDEMIERVFPGSAAGDQRPLPPASAQAALATPPAARASRGSAAAGVLARLQPIHVVIGCTVLAMLVMLVVFMASGFGQHPAPKPKSAPTASAPKETPTESPVADQPTTMVPPGDSVESGDTPSANTVTPNTATERPVTTAERPTTTAERPTPPAVRPAQPVSPISPPSPLANIAPPVVAPAANAQALTSEALEKQTQQLKTLLDSVAKSGKLQITVNDVSIDPRTGVVSIDYAIPRMINNGETKKGLLYAGFNLIWSTLRQSTEPRTFTLHGSAYVGTSRNLTTALVADVTWQQMEGAHNAGDYRAIQQFLTNPWWRDDLAGVPVEK